MHKGIEKISQKTPPNQGVGYGLGRRESVESDASLFERFSEILEKIASSLSTQQQGEELPDPAQFVAHFEAPPQAPVVVCRAQPNERAPEKIEDDQQTDDEAGQPSETPGEDGDDHPGRAVGHSNEQRLAAHARRDERAESRAERKEEGKADANRNDEMTADAGEREGQPVETVPVELPAETVNETPLPLEAAGEQAVPAAELPGEVSEDTGTPAGEEATLPAEAPFMEQEGAPVAVETAGPAVEESAPAVSGDVPVQPRLESAETAPVTDTPATGPEQQSAAPEEIETATPEQQLTTAETLQMRTLTVNDQPARASKRSEIDTRSENQALLARAMEALLSQSSTGPATKALADGVVNRSTTALKAAQPLNLQNSATGIVTTKRGAEREDAKGGSDLKGMPRAQALRTLERVESALREVARSKDGRTISLRLDPPELGTVKIDVTIRENHLHARMSAESAQVSALLRERSPEIQAALRKLGFDLEKVTVSVQSSLTADIGGETSKRSKNFTEEMTNFARAHGGQGESTHGNRNTAGDSQSAATDHWVA